MTARRVQGTAFRRNCTCQSNSIYRWSINESDIARAFTQNPFDLESEPSASETNSTFDQRTLPSRSRVVEANLRTHQGHTNPGGAATTCTAIAAVRAITRRVVRDRSDDAPSAHSSSSSSDALIVKQPSLDVASHLRR